MPEIDLPDEWRAMIIDWARETNAVDELWLFGSRAKGTARPDSDFDIAVSLMPAQGDHDWALGDYFALANSWQRELEAIVGRHVSLTAILPDTPGDTEVRSTGLLLWRRAADKPSPAGVRRAQLRQGPSGRAPPAEDTRRRPLHRHHAARLGRPRLRGGRCGAEFRRMQDSGGMRAIDRAVKVARAETPSLLTRTSSTPAKVSALEVTAA